MILEILTLDVLHDNILVGLVLILEIGIKAYDIGMLELTVDSCFSFNNLQLAFNIGVVLIYLFYC